MTATRKITIEVPEEVALRMEAEVAAGRYANASDVVTTSVRSQLYESRYDGSDPEVERWLVEEVGPTYDAYKADPSRLLTEDEAFELLDALRARRSTGA